MNIPYAYADLRFNPSFDKQTGYFTRSILCVPVINKEGRLLDVHRYLIKVEENFTDEDESRLKAFTQQVAIALENAKLFEDVSKSKYNESMLSSMSNGVITINSEEEIVTCNKSGLKNFRTNLEIIKSILKIFFLNKKWIYDKIKTVTDSKELEIIVDAEIEVLDDETEKEMNHQFNNITFDK